MLGREIDTDFEWRLKAGPARRAERDPHPVGPGSDTPEGEAAIRLALQGLHHLPRVVHQLHQGAAHGLQGFAPVGPHRSSDLAPDCGCGWISFYAPYAARREANGLRPVPQHQIDPRDLPLLGPDLDADFGWRLKAGPAHRAERDPNPVGPGEKTSEGEAAIRLALQGLLHLPRVVHQLHQGAAYGLQGFAPAGPHRSSDLAPDCECGWISFYAPCAALGEANRLRPVPQHQIDPGDLPLLGPDLDADFEWRLKAGRARRVERDPKPVGPGSDTPAGEAAIRLAP